MKVLLSVLCLVAFVTLATTSSNTWGRRNSSDYLLLRETVVRNPQYNNYWSVNVEFPKPGQGNSRTISAIYVIDRFTNSSGAAGSLWSGGPGYRFATINLKSQNGRGINSTVEIYGK